MAGRRRDGGAKKGQVFYSDLQNKENKGTGLLWVCMTLAVKRVYEKPASRDGTRVLVDRLWPRGLTKEAAAVDLWLRELAPSHELRKW